MNKNWIIWRRSLFYSILELLSPIALMSILVITRVAIKKQYQQPRSNLDYTTFFSPVDYLKDIQNNTDYSSAFDKASQYMDFINFNEINITRINPIIGFTPTGCLKQSNTPGRPIIAYSGKQSLTSKVVSDIQAVQAIQQRLITQYSNSSDPEIKSVVQQLQQATMVFQFQEFNSKQDILNYLSDKSYMASSNKQGICFAFSIDQNSKDNYDISLLFNDQEYEPGDKMIPSQSRPAYSKYFDLLESTQSYSRYTRQGYSYLQNWIANEILREQTNVQNASIAMTIAPFKTDVIIIDTFANLLELLFQILTLMLFGLPMYSLIQNMVLDKETKVKQYMLMMGLNQFSYWLSWFIFYLIKVTIISALSTLVLAFNVFVHTNKGILFLYFFTYGMTFFGFAVFMQSFFSSNRQAAVAVTLIYFGTSFLDFIIREPVVGITTKTILSIFPTIAVQRGANNFALFETKGFGVQFSNINDQFENYRLSICFIAMFISFWVFLIIGLYLDQVLPQENNVRKPWYFCFTRSFCCCRSKGRKVSDQVDNENYSDFETKYMKSENFEPPSKELLTQEYQNEILKISDLYKSYPNGLKAVQGLNLKMYNGQIFALLGHNGAGKTTTISILIGLIKASSGSAEVFDLDLFNEQHEVRKKLGVCFQQDVLFELLTPEEHLNLFCDIKGINRRDKQHEIDKIINDIDLITNKHTLSKNLSGGNKRKLSVAVALIGGSKLVILDEPTSGMDLCARRKLWNLLKYYKSNRIIILTTHYMEEADILGDRIGIMTGGKLTCLGSSHFLKNRFGQGYKLTLTKKQKSKNLDIDDYLRNKLGNVKLLSETQSKLEYQVPIQYSHKFQEFFQKLDKNLDNLDLASYSISVTNLDDVFLNVGRLDDTQSLQESESLDLDIIKVKEDQMQNQQYKDYSISENHEKGAINIFMIHTLALIKKRLQIYKRDYKAIIAEIFIPIILVIIGLGLYKVKLFQASPERILNTHAYPQNEKLLVNQDFIVQQPLQNINTQTLIDGIPYNIIFNTNYWNSQGEQLDNVTQFYEALYQDRLIKPVTPYAYGSYFLYEADTINQDYKFSTFVNITSQDAPAYYPAFMYESILKAATGNPNMKLNFITTPFPVTDFTRKRAATKNSILVGLVIAIGFALIPTQIITFIVYEKEKNLKQLQMISGLDLPAYWISNLAFDIVKAYIPCIATIGLLYAFQINYEFVWILFLLYPLGIIPFTYCMSFLFSKESTAQTMSVFFHIIFSGAIAIIATSIRVVPQIAHIGDTLIEVLNIVPSFCLTGAVLFAGFKDNLKQQRPDLNLNNFALQNLSGNILGMCLHMIFWTLILVLIEMGFFKFFQRLYGKFKLSRDNYQHVQHQNQIIDEDVRDEEHRILKMDNQDLQVKVQNFRKVYTSIGRQPFKAVQNISFGVSQGECFALLGVNGAGKTTTFKSLTGQIVPTSGKIFINGLCINQDYDEVRKLIGYCPQHDAVYSHMTVEEHLWYYARIKGIKKELQKPLIDAQLEELSLYEHRHKLAGTLSGGNKRKLSLAISVIGNPPIILLDEPSAGMDPEARRFMWDAIIKIFQKREKTSILLTTHSMEEAEALSTKMGIMVKGGIFKCVGTSQHIKNKFSTGYEIEVKIKKKSIEELSNMLDHLQINPEEQSHQLKIRSLLQDMNIHPMIQEQLELKGLEIIGDIEEKDQSKLISLTQWLYVEKSGLKIITDLLQYFEVVQVLEHYNEYYKFRVSKNVKSIGSIFSLLENEKENLNINEYSVQLTSLEQIFQTFANQNPLTQNLMYTQYKIIDNKLVQSNDNIQLIDNIV